MGAGTTPGLSSASASTLRLPAMGRGSISFARDERPRVGSLWFRATAGGCASVSVRWSVTVEFANSASVRTGRRSESNPGFANDTRNDRPGACTAYFSGFTDKDPSAAGAILSSSVRWFPSIAKIVAEVRLSQDRMDADGDCPDAVLVFTLKLN